MGKVYIAIDLKSFYASVECVERGLDPLKTNLVVADPTRSEKTICLAVSPSLKAYGIPGRARLFEVNQRVREVNRQRLYQAKRAKFIGKSVYSDELQDPSFELDFVIAPPQMAHYIEKSSEIYQIYLKYIAPEDIHVYSIDEVFMDVTAYLNTYHMKPRQLAQAMIQDVQNTTGITATAGIGTNLYLCKVAMDIVAKHIPADENGVRIASLDEKTYRKLLWTHRPLKDFWRVGRGYVKKLEALGLTCMGDIARFSLDEQNEALLYKIFGINAELLIDHAWGYEPCTIADIKAYKPENNSISSGQVLPKGYGYESARLIVREMAESLALDLFAKRLVTDQIVLSFGYEMSGLDDYDGEVGSDYYGRTVPKQGHGQMTLDFRTSSTRLIVDAVLKIFDQKMNRNLQVRRIYVIAAHVVSEDEKEVEKVEQLDLFSNVEVKQKHTEEEKKIMEKDRLTQDAILQIQRKYGKNAVVKGSSLLEDSTAMERNEQIGGHRA